MRIGIIAPPWLPIPPDAYGGTESVLDRLARGLHAAGHEPVLFTTGDSTCPVTRRWVFERADATYIGTAALEFRHVIHAYEALRDCDVVHDHTLIGPLYADRYPELPAVTTIHGPFNDELNDLYRVVSHRTPVIAISRSQAAEAHPGVRFAGIIHHGIETADVPFNAAGGGGYCVFLGRMAPAKGAHRAAEVARRAGVRLLIAAKMREPAEQAFFDAEVKPLLGDGVEYIGEVGGAEKFELLAGADALLNPIRWSEPFGLVMIESLACGTPVLSFKEGAAPEIIDHGVTGFFCTDEADMVDHLARLDELNRVSCRAVVEERFSVERMVADHVAVYRRLVDGVRATPAA